MIEIVIPYRTASIGAFDVRRGDRVAFTVLRQTVDDVD